MKYRLNRKFTPWLFSHFLEFVPYYITALLSLFALHYFQSLLPELSKQLGDNLVNGEGEAVSVWVFIGIAAAILIFRTLSRLLFFYPARVQQKNLRAELMHRMELAHPARYAHHNDGNLFRTIFNDLNGIRGFIGFALLQVGNIVIALSVFIPKIKEFNSELLYAFIPLLCGVFIFSIMTLLMQPIMKKSMDAYAEIQNNIIESYDGKVSIKNFHREKSFINLFKTINQTELSLYHKSQLGRIFAMPLLRLCFGVTLLLGAYIIKQNDLGGTSLIFFSGFIFLIMEPIAFMAWIGVVFVHGISSWKRIEELVNDTQKQSNDELKVKEIGEDKFKVPFWDKWLEIQLKKKEWLVLAGETGVGKSYLMQRIADGLSLAGKKFCLVSQEPYLYNDTIIDNIFLGNEVTEEKLELAKKLIHIFGLDLLANTIDEVLETEVGENGKKVSGGQAKRIILIRSLLSNVEYLLWDDPFSSVDFILEKKILDELKELHLLENTTFILSTHRISTVRYCDSVIFVTREGGIVEQGDVKKLLDGETKVSEYFKKQLV